MAVANARDQGILVSIVHLVRVDVAQILAGNLSPLFDALVAATAGNEGVDDAVGDLLCTMRLNRVLGELARGVANLPEIKVEGACVEIDGDNVGGVEGVVSVWVRRLDRVAAGGVAEHAVAGHLDVERVLFAVAEGVGQDPLDALAAARQAVDGVAMLGPDQSLVVGVPVELEALLGQQVLGHGELHLEPVRRPAGAKGGADVGGRELVARGLFEERTRLARGRVDGQLDVAGVGALDAGLVELAARALATTAAATWTRLQSGRDVPHQTLIPILARVGELPQPAGIDAVDLLAHRPSSQLRVLARRS